MNRLWKTWLLFGCCATIVLAVLGWLSRITINLEQGQLEAADRAAMEEHARLALWRLDSALAPLIVEESARPWSSYEPFSGNELAYTRAGPGFNRARQGDVLVASPLLAFSSSNVLLHFQFRPGQRATSPQVPEGELRALAESGYTSAEHIAISAQRLEQMRRILGEKASRPAPDVTSKQRKAPAPDAAFGNADLLAHESSLTNPTFLPPVSATGSFDFRPLANQDARQSDLAQSIRNTSEFIQRANVSQQGQLRVMEDNSRFNQLATGAPMSAGPGGAGESVFKPVWLGTTLVLARQARIGNTSMVQGVWLNWTNLRPVLLSTISDLFPSAELEPAPPPVTGHEARLLASLPVRLVPGQISPRERDLWTPVRLTLAFAWLFVIVAAAAVASLLHGTLSLSERRAAFVSAVTHELRTPLMTFRMYSEMLAEGMVPDEKQRRQYLATLCSEATRLSHLVENVLAYARLERRSARSRMESVTLGSLVERVLPRLMERAALAGLTIREQIDRAAADAPLHLDVTAVEQILFNLVDNACKYAAPAATNKVIQLDANIVAARHVCLRVVDHGPGLSAGAARTLFEPFSKSADEAAQTAPGIGLGLALCRRLARSIGGELRLRPAEGDRPGACFELLLPVSTSRPASLA